MKYIKIYEFQKINKYNIGDCVSLYDDIFARIIDYRYFDSEEPNYYIEIFNKINHKFFNNHWIDQNDIERKLTLEEMKIIEFAEDTKKYNL